MKRIKKPLEKEIRLIVARLIMNQQKDLFLSQPNRTHPESTALEYAEKTGLQYDDLLKYYTHPCPLNNEKEGEIAFEILAFKIKEKNITRDQLYQLHFNVEGLISNKTMNKFCDLFFTKQ